MARRVAERLPPALRDDHFPFYSHVFTAVASATVATPRLGGARDLVADRGRPGHRRPRPPVGRRRRGSARALAEAGYRPPGETPIPVLGRRGIAAAEALTYNQLVGRQMSEHDRRWCWSWRAS